MSRGGARVRSGPAPDPTALRRDRDGKTWAKLPASGRRGPIPPWPLQADPTVIATIEHLRHEVTMVRERWGSAIDADEARRYAFELSKLELRLSTLEAKEAAREEAETRMWNELWRTPQAVVWEADGSALTVALYVRTYLEATLPDAGAGMRGQARQMSETLLLTPMSLYAARYVIAPDEEPAVPAAAAAGGSASAPAGVRGRLAVVRPATEGDDDAE